MSPTFPGTLFDGETLTAQAVVLTPANGGLQVSGAGGDQLLAAGRVRVSDRLGSVPRYLYLPDGQTIVTPDNDAVDGWLAGHRRGRLVALIHWLELRSHVAAAATVLLVALVAATVWWGLPVLARKVALAVPASMEAQAGRASLATVDQILAPTQLGYSRQSRVRAQLDRLVKAGGFKEPPKLIFRSMGGQSPNAFALPGGLIVVSDELVKLAEDDEEIAAVLAHEIGHWQLRHGLQSVLRGSSALLVVSAVTGDLSTLTGFAGTIPFLLLQRGYSRDFEEEADAYGLNLLAAAGIDRRYFVVMLQRLEKARPTAGRDFTYLSTHPSTAERIARIAGKAGMPAPAPNRPVEAPATTPPATTAAGGGEPSGAVAGRATPLAGEVRPRPLSQAPPVYPTTMSASGTQGEVTVEFVIDENGDVREMQVVQSSRKEFEGPALAAVSQWKFSPGQISGRNIATRTSQRIEFKLEARKNPPGPPIAPASLDTLSKH